MRSKIIIFIMAAFAACALQGATIVSWSGMGDTAFNLPTATDTSTTRTWEYSATTPVLANGAGTYTGVDFYGALQDGSSWYVSSSAYTGSVPDTITPKKEM